MKRILFVMQSLYNGGAEKSLVNLLNELPADRYEIDILLFKHEGTFLSQLPECVNILDTPDSLKKLYAPVSKAGNMKWIKIGATIMSRIKKTKRPMQIAYRWKCYYSKQIPELEQKFDVAVAYISGEVMYYIVEKVNAKKKLVWIHNDYKAAGHPADYDREYLEKMDAVVTISEKCVEILNDVFPSIMKKTFCVPNLTSSTVVRERAEEFYPDEFGGNQWNILSIGRLSEQKGFDWAIKAAKQMKIDGIDFKWFVIGSGAWKQELNKLIKQEGVSEYFKLIGSRENPYPYIKNCTVFVQTSRWEGKSVVLDEAKILGVPIVVTNYPTVSDQIIDGREGKIVEMSPKGIAKGIEKVLNNVGERTSLRQYLLAHEYGNQKEIKKYIDLFEN